MINKEELKILINERFPGVYNSSGMEVILDSIEIADERIKTAIEKYLSQGVEPEMDFEGFTYEGLRKNLRMNPIAALLTLDYLIKEPEKAKESLKRGHDYIIQNKSFLLKEL